MGADLVFGHGSHTVQPIQIYKGKVICYSLSNFTFGANAAPKDSDTVVVQLIYDINPDGTMTAAELIVKPFQMHQDKDFRPCPIKDEEGFARVMSKLVFSRAKDPDSCLPEDFQQSGYADLRPIVHEQLAAME